MSQTAPRKHIGVVPKGQPSSSHTSMKRARVKTKTGCSTCRSRRKKCDEEKPICGACVRLKLHCDWIYVPRNAQLREASLEEYNSPLTIQHVDSVQDGRFVKLEESVSPKIPITSTLHLSPTRMRPSDQQILHADKRYHPKYIVPDYLQTFVTPMAKQEYKRSEPWLSIIMSQPWSRDAIMAFGASWLSLSDQQYMLPCSQFYASAIKGLQAHLRSTADMSGVDIECGLVASYFLGLFETFWSKHTTEPMYHFSAVANMLAVENVKRGRYRSVAMERMCTVIWETMLYNVTTNAMFAKDLSVEMQTWEGMQVYFQGTTDADSKDPSWSISPLLAGRREVFSLALQIMWLCRQDLTDPEVQSHVQRCVDRQQRAFDELDSFYPKTFLYSMLLRYRSRFTIMLRTLQILLLKLQRPDICSAHPDMQEATNALFHATRTQITSRTRLMSDGLSWPFCTLLCSANTLAQFEEAQAIAREFIPIMANGVQHRMSEAVRLIGMKRKNIVSECQLLSRGKCDGKHSCLDVLIHPNGVLVGAVT